ncbi:hypothetical protein M011DRAFT_165025 [Sporormia fimetaria CBS 119925]|uniref:Uncharacterized protein n=1 Tax=Sporormia fimetaria CBS 119925 TaxID=1340428 RepID=A0A6A6V4N8_9PLEO|nr:hypothetical protein M011DRAFT_165025 [Sporormia fimetaria CBS 119925]
MTTGANTFPSPEPGSTSLPRPEPRNGRFVCIPLNATLAKEPRSETQRPTPSQIPNMKTPPAFSITPQSPSRRYRIQRLFPQPTTPYNKLQTPSLI